MQSDIKHTNVMLANFTLTRLVVSTAFRLMFPFLPIIARGLGVSLESVALIVSARSAMGITAPFLGSVADYVGRKTALIAGLALFSAGLLIVAFFPGYGTLAIGLLISSLGNILVDSTIYAYIGDNYPYQNRGKAIAIVESGWSGAYLIGIPIAGWLIANGNWNTPFFWLALAGVGLLILQKFFLPKVSREEKIDATVWDGMRSLLKEPAAQAILLFSLMILFANQLINIIFGAWMEAEHSLTIEGLGNASSVLGFAGIAGLILVFLITDKIGKKRAIGLGVIVNILACIALPLAKGTLTGTLVSLFFFYLSFEFTLTSSLPLMTEIVPGARATLMATNVAAIALGDALGASIGPFLFQWGIITNVAVTVAINLLAFMILIFFVETGSQKPLILASE